MIPSHRTSISFGTRRWLNLKKEIEEHWRGGGKSVIWCFFTSWYVKKAVWVISFNSELEQVGGDGDRKQKEGYKSMLYMFGWMCAVVFGYCLHLSKALFLNFSYFKAISCSPEANSRPLALFIATYRKSCCCFGFRLIQWYSLLFDYCSVTCVFYQHQLLFFLVFLFSSKRHIVRGFAVLNHTHSKSVW